MIKQIFLFGIIVFFQASQSFGQNLQKFTPVQMKEDVDTLVKDIEETHPNPFYRCPRQEFINAVDSVKKSLKENLTLIQFYLKVEPLLVKLKDGHTNLDINGLVAKYNKSNPFILPYDFRLYPTKPFMICERPYRSFEELLPKGAQIISINKIPVQKIVNDIIDLNTGERLEFRAAWGSNYFEDFYLEALYKMNGIYNVKFKNNDSIKTVTINGIRKVSLDKRLKYYSDTAKKDNSITSKNYTLKLLENKSIAIISFTLFDWDGYQSFIDSAFTVIKNKRIKNLIIDIRGNGGGYSDVSDDFFQYLLNVPYKQYAKVINKNSQLLKDRLKAHHINKPYDSADLALLKKLNGTIDTTYYSDIPIKANPLRFYGNVYLLTNAQTFSSATDFAQCFKYYKRGKIIGEETGGLIKSYGDVVTTTLPNSKLELEISSKLYYDIGAGNNDWIGVKPDILTTSDGAMKKALEIIKRNN